MRSERHRRLCPCATTRVILGHVTVIALAAQAAFAQGGATDSASYALELPADLLTDDCQVLPLPPVEYAAFERPCAEPDPASADWRGGCGCQWDLDFLARGYYLNDQRIEWSGVEATFGAEAVLAPVIKHRWGRWLATAAGEFYLNQPCDRNILADTGERASYLGNYCVDTFEISQLFLLLANGEFSFAVGKIPTPFGRTHFPLFSNARLDAPFIRTEAVLWRETGLRFRYELGPMVADVALTNGGEDRDANSSKALVSRVGLETDRWAVGASVKVQDGIGSETQKTFNSHVGMDCMLRRGPWTLSGEVIYDEYGFRRPGFDPADITWGRSIYYRDQNYRMQTPITGIGYYLNLAFEAERWAAWLNYGEYYPQQLGDPKHDIPNRRGIVKAVYALTPHLEMYAVVMMETEGYVAQDGRLRRGTIVLTGFQWTL